MKQKNSEISNLSPLFHAKVDPRCKHRRPGKRFVYYKYFLNGGFSIQVAILAFLVVILGSVALASRVTSGLWGASAQSQNQEARSAAEAGLLEVINEFNKEQNRMLLLSDSPSPNECTKYTSDSGTTTSTSQPVGTRALAILATTTSSPGYINLIGSSTKQFKVQKIEYLDRDRVPLAVSANTSISDILQSGRDRTLIRLTVVGKATSFSGKESFSRIAREYEVVPKCCRRSFGFNTSAGLIWGGDNAACLTGLPGGGSSGIVGGLNGGIKSMQPSSASGGTVTAYVVTSLGASPVLVPVTRGLCYAGTPAGSTYLLSPDSFTAPSPNNCLSNSITAGSVSFVPDTFTFAIPPESATGASSPAPVNVSCPRKYYIDTSASPVVKYNQTGGAGCSNSSGLTATNCRIDSTVGTLHIAKCFFQSISLSGGDEVVFDTSKGRFDNYFQGPGCTKGSESQYTCLNGNAMITRVQCSSTAPSCSTPINHLTYTADLKYGNPYIPGVFDNSERLNFYVRPSETVANLIFDVRGSGSTGTGINIIAPKAGISILGTGSVIGRLWSDVIRFNGNAKIETIGAPISSCTSLCPNSATTGYDVLARSHTQATAF